MSLFDKITAKNFNAFAMKHYEDPQCEDIEDFHEDLRRFRYLKRLLTSLPREWRDEENVLC